MRKKEEEEEKNQRSGCCLSSLFRHPCRSPFVLAGTNIPKDESVAAAASSSQCVPDDKPPRKPTKEQAPEGQVAPNNRTRQDRMTRKRSKRLNQLVRASSSNVMLLANLGNLRGKRNATVSPNRDVLDFLPKTAKELEMDAKSKEVGLDAEQLKEMGNEEYKKGKYAEAVALYDRAIAKDRGKASYWSNKAAALIGLGQLLEAVGECEEAVRIDPSYCRAHYRLAVLYARLGDPEKAINHYKLAGTEATPEDFSRAEAFQTHLAMCEEARQCKDWHTLLKQTQSVVSLGADSAPQVFASQAEALLNLHRHEEANETLTSAPKFDTDACTKFFGAAVNSYCLAVRAQVDMAAGRFEEAVVAVQKAVQIDGNRTDLSFLVKKALAMASTRSRGNDLFKAAKFEEACNAYGEGLHHDPYNAILLCNRAACLVQLREWERAVQDCSTALKICPSYNKARLRRADCNAKLERWAEAIEDYEVLLHEMAGDDEVVKALFEAHVHLEKQQGATKNSSHGADFARIRSLESFRQIVMLPGISVVYFENSNEATKQLVPSLEQLQFPSVKFLKVNVEECPYLATSENMILKPVFRVYKNGANVEDIMRFDINQLESTIKHLST